MINPSAFDQWLSVELPQAPGLAPTSYVGNVNLSPTLAIAIPDTGAGFGYLRFVYLLQGGGHLPDMAALQPQLPVSTRLAVWPLGGNVFGGIPGTIVWANAPIAIPPSWLLPLVQA